MAAISRLATASADYAMALTAAVSIAVFIAAPWLDQQLVWCGWLGIAAALLVVGRIRGWWGEFWTIISATIAIAIAFHWTPKVLAFAMAADYPIGLAIAAPIVLWDALRLALPLLIAARITPDPLRAWLPAGLTAVAIEAAAPAVFPWKLGYCQIAWPWLVQSVDLFGPEFSTLVLYGHAGVIAWLVQIATRYAGGAERAASRRCLPAATFAAIVLCIANAAYGWWAMGFWSRAADAAPHVDVALVQANPEEDGGLGALRTLTADFCAAHPTRLDLVFWPECSGGCYDQQLVSFADPDEVLKLSRPPNAGMRPLENPTCPILFGGKFYEGHPERPRALYQSGILVAADQTIIGRYHKRHLMPFGEYVPGEDWFPDIERYFPMQDEFTSGRYPTVLEAPSARLGVMLCYEDMISTAAQTVVGEGADLLVSLINGSAFTEPLTLEQHRLLAQLRAVEYRRSLIRCAATGDTCVITPTGTIEYRLPLHARGVLAAQVPLLRSSTLYGLTGRVFPIIAAAGLGFHVWWSSRAVSRR